MPTFDVVSEVNLHEAANGVDQANREVETRFDFKGTGAHFELADSIIALSAETEFQLHQMMDVLRLKLAKRSVDMASLKVDPPTIKGKSAKQNVTLMQGIDADLARKIVKKIKDSKMKVQAAVQGDKVRVTGKQRDDLQECIALLRGAEFEQPLQFNNFRD